MLSGGLPAVRVTETSHMCSVLGLFLVEDSDLGGFFERENGCFAGSLCVSPCGFFFLRLRLRAVVAGVYILSLLCGSFRSSPGTLSRMATVF